MRFRGRIIEEQKNYYLVDSEQGLIRSALKGLPKTQHKRLFVGDFVDIELLNSDSPEGIIRTLYPRTNALQKPSVANVDRVLLICTFKEPVLDLDFLDKFLFSCGVLHFPVIIVFNKSDLLTTTEKDALSKIIAWYENAGYACMQASALTGENIESIITHCRNTFSIFAGESGTGKSAILSRIFPDHTFRIGALSKNIHRGVHTTTSTTLLKLSESGYIADTPGFSAMELPQIPEEDVVSFFPDIALKQGSCKFSNCIHENEPGCTIKEMVKNGEIMGSRYLNYLKIYKYMHLKNRDYQGKKRDSGLRS